jgi:hypothetical protein
MNSYRPTFALIGLFFAGLLALWWLEYSGVPTEAQRRQRMSRILPALMDTAEAAIDRVEIERNGQTLAFERRGQERWQMTKPLDVAADSTTLETLVRNLKDLRRSPDTGPITGPGEAYGLAPPSSVVRLFSSAGSRPVLTSGPLAALEIGKSVQGLSYVRTAGTTEIDVVDTKLLSFVDRSPTDWRELNLVPIPTFQVSRLAINRDRMSVSAERGAGGRWRLRAPVTVPASGPKIESALAALSSIRVLDGAKGFVADNVTDFARYGLDHPDATIELFTPARSDEPLVLHIGKKPPDHPDRVYVRRGDQDDVVLVSDRFLTEIPRDSTTLRGQNVTDIVAAEVSEIRVEAFKTIFTLQRQRDGWALLSPRAEKADSQLVQSLLSQLDGLKTSEFLSPGRVIRPDLEPPDMTIKAWQAPSRGANSTAKGNSSDGSPPEPPVLSLRIGRHDRLKKTVYGQIEGDDVILALPDLLLDHLPRNQYAFRDRLVLTLSPVEVSKLTLAREGTTTILVPDRSSSSPNRWRMTAPVNAPADVQAITQLLALLSDLRAEEFAADSLGDGKSFGLDHPPIVLSWESESASAAPSKPSRSASPSGATGRLRIGKPVIGKPGTFFAALDGQPFVFTLAARAIQALVAEFHETQVLSIPADAIRRLVFRLPGKSLAFVRSPQPRGRPADWSAEPGTDIRGIDLSRFNDLVTQLAQLRTPRFYQYEGPITSATGLARPRLVLEFHLQGDKPPQVLRIGATQAGAVLAATGTGDSGPVILLPAAAWNALIQSISPALELPEKVFAP